ncbi:hypothetical protein [Micromonospora sp. NPDC093277]|uniref:hypothetical protein n=1 Tax=Micromonospora sp. NPDC093277 TaxID=3364291 RepID=UPI0038004143
MIDNLGRIIGIVFEPGKLAHIAWGGERRVGLSIIENDDDRRFDVLTLIEPSQRHRGLATALKRHAPLAGRQAGCTAL